VERGANHELYPYAPHLETPQLRCIGTDGNGGPSRSPCCLRARRWPLRHLLPTKRHRWQCILKPALKREFFTTSRSVSIWRVFPPGVSGRWRHALETIAGLLSGGQSAAEDFLWSEMGFRETATVRSTLARRYEPATVNRMLSALRGVLRHAWRLGAPGWRGLPASGELQKPQRQVAPSWPNPFWGRAPGPLRNLCGGLLPGRRAGHRLLAVLYGGGLRRAEAAALDISDFDPDARVLYIRNWTRYPIERLDEGSYWELGTAPQQHDAPREPPADLGGGILALFR